MTAAGLAVLLVQLQATGDLGTAADGMFAAGRLAWQLRPAAALTIEPAAWAARREDGAWLGVAGARFGLGRGAARAWLGLDAGRLDEGPTPDGLVQVRVGGALMRGAFTLEASVAEGRTPGTERLIVDTPSIPIDTGGVVEQPPETRRVGVPGRLWRDVEARVAWRGGRIDASLAGGARFEIGAPRAARARRWLVLEGCWWVTPRVAVVPALATRARAPVVRATPAGGAVSLAVRVALGRTEAVRPMERARRPAAFEVRRLGSDGVHALRVHVPRARRVELTGDFLEWRVVELERRRDGVWETRVVIPPGSHRVNIRVDGGPWIVPPGLAAVADDFSGKAGVLRVPA